MGKFFKSVIIGTATGIATAYFLTTKKGKVVKERVEQAFEDYKANPDHYHKMAKDKSYEYSNLAKDTFTSYKNKFESGELTPEQVVDTVKEKANAFVQKASQQFTEQTNQAKNSGQASETVNEDDIIIDYSDIEEPVPTSSSAKDDDFTKNLKSDFERPVTPEEVLEKAAQEVDEAVDSKDANR
ncbi:YtxH domain-containing protein [Streptococcus halichoeri]|uniref:YtxH domain-containing protein n=1 Tax=Streptococcus halichoeri TaxID=254785 RepID=UPI00135C0A10|nr:YtxH domain-containing protein [Streptococcus halichoeri]